MNKSFYPKLAITNIKSNGKTYLPYMITSVATVMVFYIMSFISSNPSLDNMFGGSSLKAILAFGMIVIGFFSTIFLFYTNGFLMKRRKKEIGLYNILGMEKRHIMRVLLYEALITAGVSILLGILLGIVMSKLILLLLFKIIAFDVVFGFQISGFAIMTTVILFGCIFMACLLSNLGRIHLTQPIELLRGGQHGEKEPKSKWLLTLVGVACLGGGYYIALTTEKPLAALSMFFVAVMLVIIGTFALFTAGSIFVLKLLRKNKRFYYQTKHFTSVSGLIYRMKQNAAGLSNICILSTIVLVMISTTSSLYLGMDDAMRARYPRNIVVEGKEISAQKANELTEVLKQEISREKLQVTNMLYYRCGDFTFKLKDNVFMDAKGANLYDNSMASVVCMPLSEYNRLNNKSEQLKPNEVLLCTNDTLEGSNFQIGQHKFNVVKRLDSPGVFMGSLEGLVQSYFFVMADELTIQQLIKDTHANKKSTSNELRYIFGFDTDASVALQSEIPNQFKRVTQKIAPSIYTEAMERTRKEMFGAYGGLLFIGMFLGALFIMATVMIIYYKQITEGYDDRERFEIMRKVGMSRDEVKKTIKSQVLIVFFLPLIVAIIHICFAFGLITKMLFVLGLTNTTLFAICTAVVVVVFAVFYMVVYTMTARVYYKIVS